MPRVDLLGFQAGWARPTIGSADWAEPISCTIESGSWVAVVGANGVGKSTLLRGLAGTAPYTTGAVQIDGVRLETLEDRSRAGVLYVSQEGPWRAGRLPWDDAQTLAWIERPALRNQFAAASLRMSMHDAGWHDLDNLTPRAFELVAAVLSAPGLLLLDEVLPALPGDASGATRYKAFRQLVPATTCLFVEHNINVVIETADAVLEIIDDKAAQLLRLGSEESANYLRKNYGADSISSADTSEGGVVATDMLEADRLARWEIELAVRASTWWRPKRAERRQHLREDFGFMFTKPRKTIAELSGGQRIMVGTLLATIGLRERVPRAQTCHVDERHKKALDKWIKLFGPEA